MMGTRPQAVDANVFRKPTKLYDLTIQSTASHIRELTGVVAVSEPDRSRRGSVLAR